MQLDNSYLYQISGAKFTLSDGFCLLAHGLGTICNGCWKLEKTNQKFRKTLMLPQS